jgi:NAD(P)-dependent dehydrogenase (short-subunit alcohol dehydrogenase family)
VILITKVYHFKIPLKKIKQMNKFSNKVAVVTGGNSGIGYATAKELVAQGAKVIITGRRKDAIEQAAKELGAFSFVADQSKLEDIEALSMEVSKQFGKVDILFINAGIVGESLAIEDMTEVNFDSVMNVNFKGAYFTLNKFVPILNDGASVVFLSSMVASTYKPNSSIYQASKAALNSIANTAAAELASRKIRVNLVSPGPTKTEVLSKNADKETVDGIFDYLREIIPLKKIGIPEDVAKLVIYLSDEASSYITGSDFVIDGGLTLN